MQMPSRPGIRPGESVSRRRLLYSLISAGPAAGLLRGQKDTTFSSDVKVVNVLATVRNKQGQIIHNLNKEDFALTEDGRAQTIRYFSQETDLPLTLGLLVDTSLSQRRVLDEERNASYRFLDQVLREDKDLAFVIHFDTEVELLQDFTSSRKKLESSLGSLRTPEPGFRGRRYPPGPRAHAAGSVLGAARCSMIRSCWRRTN
ncbi:MAG: von Willebrand factor, type [Bryobacterales bacterium]|nr:von Willebrand factor, type [Bryobacterales bacterium]